MRVALLIVGLASGLATVVFIVSGLRRGVVRRGSARWSPSSASSYCAGAATCCGMTSHTNSALTRQTAATTRMVWCSPVTYAAW